ncbi:hypothetical protein K458DRAFT_366687 [Lentithecium fluviatile CBS 122367]|uniref:PWI domain-containing protein n=1 Tax=Lentithecium fluviatile CBS 122367 TaxID=1168545 RepID=A0A6G1J1G3_9PLEO|nr:hypothetical protein K458DRAFT_366687 [Lentithecium fluviatile CBS 122367]
MFNYGAPGFNRPPGYGGSPPGMAPPPGLAPPPGTSTPTAPGVAPPGVHYNGPPPLGGPRPLPSGFQPPAGMPNINFSAPVIRLGTTGTQRVGAMDSLTGRRESAAPARRGLGMDGPDSGRRDEVKVPLHPPTREEIARTIFVSNIPDGVGGDEGVEAILNTAGGLKRFLRATDANNKPQTFGFAEYTDAQSLRTATEIFKDLRVPTKRQKPGQKKEDNEEVDTTTLQVMVDDASIKYAEEWTKNEDEATVQFRIDSAKESLASVIAQMFNPPNMPQNDYGDAAMHDAPMPEGDNVPILNIDITAGEDELADIPAEMREIVAAEITAFRDRSIKRDQERLRREEEIEAEQRKKDRRVSPPASAPSAPGGANGIPLGPRADRGIQGAPSGPRGSQFPRDYQGGVNFVNGGAIHNGMYIDREDDDDSASDSEIERRRKKKNDAELDDVYKKQLARWLKQESRSVSSLERTHDRMKNKEAEQQAARDAQASQLKNFDDEAEASQKRHLYYRDHGEYMRERQKTREREEKEDRIDRDQENRELAAQQKRKDYARDQADAFLDQQAEEMLQAQAPRETQQFKISLGAAAKKLEQTAAPRRTAADVEILLEDEEVTDQQGTKKRTLRPIDFEAAARNNLDEDEIIDAQRQLARDIPNDKEGLWRWPISWEHLSDKHIDKDIRDWAAEKVLETVGVQEDLLVDAIVEHLRNRGNPVDLVDNLDEALDDEAEALVKKLWRMVIYYSEVEKRGIK